MQNSRNAQPGYGEGLGQAMAEERGGGHAMNYLMEKVGVVERGDAKWHGYRMALQSKLYVHRRGIRGDYVFLKNCA